MQSRQDEPLPLDPADDQPAHISIRVDLARGEQVTFTIRQRDDQQIEIIRGLPPSERFPQRLLNRIFNLTQQIYRVINQPLPGSPQVLFAFALFVYLLICLSGLQQFPFAFTAREAISSVQSAELLGRLAHGSPGWPMPAFFRNPLNYTLGTSVYLQAFVYFLLGQSLWVVRGASILLSLIAAYWMTSFLYEGYDLPFAWALPLVLGIAPGWLLLSRSGEPAALLATLTAGFLLYTLRCLQGQPGACYGAVILGALAFYTAPAGRIIFTAALLFFAFLALPVLRKNRGVALRALLLTIALALPFMLFLIRHTDASFASVFAPGSVWTQELPFASKITQSIGLYLAVLNPFFWFLPNPSTLLIYFIPGHAYLSMLSLPLAVLGILHILRQPGQRATQLLILMLLCAPLGAAAGQASLTNALPTAVPLLLLSAVGLSILLSALTRRIKGSSRAVAYGALILFTALGIAMLGDILTRAPILFQSGNQAETQYGTPQVFASVREIKIHNPQTIVALSGAWASDIETLRRFFIPEYAGVNITSPAQFTAQRDPNLENTIFVLTAKEFADLQSDVHFSPPSVDRILPYPNGSPAFYFVRLSYSPQFDEILAAQKKASQVPIKEEIKVRSTNLLVTHTPFDMGALINLFDDDPDTVARTAGANPLTLDIPFQSALPIHSVSILTGTDPVNLTVQLQDTQGGLHTANTSADRSSRNKTLRVEFEQSIQTAHLHIELRIETDIFPTHVHVWDIFLDPPLP